MKTSEYALGDSVTPFSPSRYLRPYVKLLGTRDLTFYITAQPQYGTLTVLGSAATHFTFQDALNQNVWYKHNREHSFHCTDSFNFTVTNENQYEQGSLVIALNPSAPIVPTPGPERGNSTLYGQTTYIFGSRDLSVRSYFCPQFIHYNVTTPPSKGVLTLYNSQHHTWVQLGTNSTFTAADIHNGYLKYSFFERTITENTSDIFYYTISDPEGELLPPRQTIHFDITLHVNGETFNISIDITSPQPLTWLSEQGVYGHLIGPSDISVVSSGASPNDILITVTQPTWGRIMNNGTPKSFFSQEDVENGRVWYASKLTESQFSSFYRDNFPISIAVNGQARVHKEIFTVEWCTVQLEEAVYTVEEGAGALNISIE